ncbi:hypothetical protein BD779DRAFT_1479081 [Infundibulicybe gibba]|nr:hypothetical protein BD779DRAFT_1479081 [Infundibulicybe gibba]
MTVETRQIAPKYRKYGAFVVLRTTARAQSKVVGTQQLGAWDIWLAVMGRGNKNKYHHSAVACRIYSLAREKIYTPYSLKFQCKTTNSLNKYHHLALPHYPRGPGSVQVRSYHSLLWILAIRSHCKYFILISALAYRLWTCGDVLRLGRSLLGSASDPMPSPEAPSTPFCTLLGMVSQGSHRCWCWVSLVAYGTSMLVCWAGDNRSRVYIGVWNHLVQPGRFLP